MKIYIDADGCPVTKRAVNIAKLYGIEPVIVCDTAHSFDVDCKVITVSKQADSADFMIANLICVGDVAVTQDYGLAALCLAKGATAVDQNGMVYSKDNIDELLYSRAASARYRRAGGRTKGPKKRNSENDLAFETSLKNIIELSL